MATAAADHDGYGNGTGYDGQEGSGDVAACLRENVRPILDLVDDLRKIGLSKDVPIPQIAVMGDQSSGKSSVLEAISGIPFPRGTGLVTRCATQITMMSQGGGDAWKAEVHAEGLPVEEMTDKAAIGACIERITNVLCGDRTFCPEHLIEVKIWAPGIPDLTIIDLPGIVRTATQDQDSEVIAQVDALYDRFLRQKRTVILAVIPSNQDIATIDILERAKQVDKTGERTMGVLTKPDLVDKGGEGEVAEVLANRKKTLKHGYVMLKNRSQEELNIGISIEGARNSEQEWFDSGAGSVYKDGRNRVGVDALTRALTELLVSQIASALPEMRLEVDKKLREAETELSALGAPPPDTNGARRAAAADCVRSWAESMRKVALHADYSQLENDKGASAHKILLFERRARVSFEEAIRKTRPGFDGERDRYDLEVTESDTSVPDNKGGAHEVGKVVKGVSFTPPQSITTVGETLSFIQKSFGFGEGKVLKVSPYFRGELLGRIDSCRGRELPGFMNFGVCKQLVAEYVGRWRMPTDTFRDALKSSVSEAAIFFVEKLATHAPGFAAKFRDHISTLLEEADTEAISRLEKLLEQEAMPHTANHYLWDTINKIRDERTAAKLEKLESDKPGYIKKADVITMLKSSIGNQSNEAQEVQDMIDILSAYWKLATKRYIDVAAMALHDTFTSHEIMNKMERALSTALVTEPEDKRLEHLFEQDPRRAQTRDELLEKLERLNKAKERLDRGYS